MYYELDKSCKKYDFCLKNMGIHAFYQSLADLGGRSLSLPKCDLFCNEYEPVEREKQND